MLEACEIEIVLHNLSGGTVHLRVRTSQEALRRTIFSL